MESRQTEPAAERICSGVRGRMPGRGSGAAGGSGGGPGACRGGQSDAGGPKAIRGAAASHV